MTVLRGGNSSIVGQYVDFCQIADEQRKLHGYTKTAIQETMRICQEKGTLVPFLLSRRKEVIDIMEMLFSQEEVWEMSRREIARNAEQKGRKEGRQEGLQEGAERRDTLYGELLRRLEPLGRAGDLLAAIADKEKLTSLAQKFGLKM